MATRLKPLSEQVIVITGASSGIGLATAHAASREGARVVLTARNQDALAQVADEINHRGGQAAYVAADVANRDELNHVADVAIERFGGFDTWVNDAGVGIYGKLDEVSEEDARRVFDTNYWGAVNGSLIAVEHLRTRGGALINVGSVASESAIPFLGAYSASKHALLGFTDALRIELELDDAPISVTLIKPTSINTPFPQHAKNYTDREPQVPPPVYQPDDVAYAILHAASHPVREAYVGGSAKIMASLKRYVPSASDWISEHVMVPNEFRDEPPRDPDGSLFEPSRDGEIYGDHPGFVRPMSVYTRASLHPVVTTAAAGLALAAGAFVTGWVLKTFGDGETTTVQRIRRRIH